MTGHSVAPPSKLIEGKRENPKLAFFGGVVLVVTDTFAVLSPPLPSFAIA